MDTIKQWKMTNRQSLYLAAIKRANGTVVSKDFTEDGELLVQWTRHDNQGDPWQVAVPRR